MKYSSAFERDYAWYLQWHPVFNFDGSAQYFTSKGESRIVADAQGLSAKLAFYLFDSQGRVIPTCEPELLLAITKCKGSVNFHVKLWAEGWLDGTFTGVDWQQVQTEYALLPWMVTAFENQVTKLYGQRPIHR
jgi:hypothetical protein